MRRFGKGMWLSAACAAVLLVHPGCAIPPASPPTPTPTASSRGPAIQTLREFLPALQKIYPSGVVVGMRTDDALTGDSGRQPGWQTEVLLPGERDHPLVWLQPNGTIQRGFIKAFGRKLQDGENVADLATGTIAPLVDSDAIQAMAEAALGVPDRMQPRSLTVQLNGPHTTCTIPVEMAESKLPEFTTTCERLSRGNLWFASAVLDEGTLTLTFEADTGLLLAVMGFGPTTSAYPPIGWTCSAATPHALLGCIKTTN